ncbi:hypothetical protein VTO73DRAFT_14994 [Trametes versicolor]
MTPSCSCHPPSAPRRRSDSGRARRPLAGVGRARGGLTSLSSGIITRTLQPQFIRGFTVLLSPGFPRCHHPHPILIVLSLPALAHSHFLGPYAFLHRSFSARILPLLRISPV